MSKLPDGFRSNANLSALCALRFGILYSTAKRKKNRPSVDGLNRGIRQRRRFLFAALVSELPSPCSQNANPARYASCGESPLFPCQNEKKHSKSGALFCIKATNKLLTLKRGFKLKHGSYYFQFPIDSRRSCSFLSASSLMRAFFLSCAFLVISGTNTDTYANTNLKIVTESAEESAV